MISEQCKTLLSYMRYFANAAGECTVYGWNPKFCTTHLNDAFSKVPKVDEPTLTALTYDELLMIGCGAWDEPDDEGNVLMLIPLWLSLILQPDIQLTCINGTTCTVDQTDNDIRFGCVAYGIKCVKGGNR